MKASPALREIDCADVNAPLTLISEMTGAVVSASVTSEVAVDVSELKLPAASRRNPAATSRVSTAPPVAFVPPNPSSAANLPVPVVLSVIVIDVPASLTIALVTSVFAKADVVEPKPSTFQVNLLQSTALVTSRVASPVVTIVPRPCPCKTRMPVDVS